MLRTGTTKHREDGLGAAHRTEIRDHGSDPDESFRKAATGAPVKASHCESESSEKRRAVTEICDREAQVN